jgi:hypothetical protein
MKGDFTRDTFDPANHFSRVLMQQGRVQVDADWNEQTSILLHYLHTLAADILGAGAGPELGLGFAIITQRTADYGDAIKAVETNNEDRVKTLTDAVTKGDLVICPGRYYVRGAPVENKRAILYSEQPGYPFSDSGTTKVEDLAGKSFLLYLDVWERHLSYAQDDRMREVALGGPDTCTRAQVVWQVKAMPRPHDVESQNFACTSLDDLLARTLPMLRARARINKPPTDLCVISPASRYRGAENQLYRVEVHHGGAATADAGERATFKWSRENGSVVFPIVSINGTTVVLESLGPDLCLSLQQGDWAELTDDWIAMSEQAGPLAQVDTVDRDTLTVTLKLPAGVYISPGMAAEPQARHAVLRRWDHAGSLTDYDGALLVDPKAGWIELEDSVQVWFAEDGEYRPRDYWLIPARVATGDVEWPPEISDTGQPLLDGDHNAIPASRPPAGPHHYYAPIFLMREGEGEGEGLDCRCTVQPVSRCPTQEE